MKPVSSSLACFLFLLLCPSRARSETWPQYRGVEGDGKSNELMPPVDWESWQPHLAWKAKTPLGFSSFAIAGGRCFTLVSDGEREACLAFDANTGKELWRSELSANDYGHDGGNAGAKGNRGGDGPRSTPRIDDDRIYVYDAQLVLSCLHAGSGDLLWKQDIIAGHDGRQIKWKNASSPIIDGDRVIVGGGGAGRSFLAFNKRDGQVAWASGDETITHATPTLVTIEGKRQAIFFTQAGLVSISPADGSEIWRVKFPFSVSTAASPVVAGNQVYCSAGYGVGAGLFQVNGKAEPDEIWFKANELMNHWSTPLVHDGHLYGIFEFKKYGKAPLQCVELATGEIKWKKPGYGPGNCIKVGEQLIVLSDTGELVIVAARPDEYQELARKDVLEGKCWSTPAYSDGKIYVRSTEEAICIDLRK